VYLSIEPTTAPQRSTEHLGTYLPFLNRTIVIDTATCVHNIDLTFLCICKSRSPNSSSVLTLFFIRMIWHLQIDMMVVMICRVTQNLIRIQFVYLEGLSCTVLDFELCLFIFRSRGLWFYISRHQCYRLDSYKI